MERCFSVLKHMFRQNRSSAKDESIIAQMRLNSVLESRTVTRASRGENLDVDNDSPLKIAIDQKVITQNFAKAVMTFAVGEQVRRRPVVDIGRNGRQTMCHYCSKPLVGHEGGQLEKTAIRCVRCGCCCALMCLGVRPSTLPSLVGRQDWVCRGCN